MLRVSGSAIRAFAWRYLIALVLAVVLTGAAVATVDREINERVADIKRVALAVAEPPPQGANYLIIGSDTREFVDNQFDAGAFGDPTSAEVSGKNSDTLMVAHVEPGSQRTLVVSFPRDLMVYVPNLGYETRINAAYGTGGPQAVIEMLKYNFDIDIHHYLEADFESFREIVNAIGNVHVYFPYAARDQNSGVGAIVAGCFPLDGDSALAYVRARHLEYNIDGEWVLVEQDAPDIYRIQRQQEFIRKLTGLAISRSLGDPFLALDVADRALQYLKLDEGVGRDEVNALIKAFRTVDVNDPNSVQFETIPSAVNAADRNTLVPAEGADEMVNRLRTFGDNTPRPSSVLPAQVNVRVLDGNGRGEAAGISAVLTQQGFVAAGTGVARYRLALTEIRYPAAQAAAAKLLLTYFDDARLVLDPTLTNRLVVVAGDSFQAITVPTTTTTLPPAPGIATAPTTTAAPAPAPEVTATTDPRAAECS